MTDRVNRPHKKSGPPRRYVRDTLSKTKRGANAIEKIRKVRVAALRKKEAVNGQTLRALEQRNPDRPLAEKQRMFVRYWAQGETPRTAAIMAGYSEGSAAIGWKMSNDPAMLKLYHEEKKLYEEAAQVTRKRVMEMLMEAYNDAKLISEPSTMVAAAREIGKMCGYYEPEKHLHVVVGNKVLDRMNSMTDEELLRFVESEPAIVGESTRVSDDAALPAPH